ncbi:MAG TPA: hypothetical protein VJ874_01205, partial [Candidatus Thermoplasmatota archaeon]|nr:hypothetical protein [Candidatus Thermoplasmatota archaeon]
MTTVLAWADDDKLLGELVAKGQALGGTVQAFDASGLPDQDSATVALGLADAAKKAGAALVLVGGHVRGRAAFDHHAPERLPGALLELPTNALQRVEQNGV